MTLEMFTCSVSVSNFKCQSPQKDAKSRIFLPCHDVGGPGIFLQNIFPEIFLLKYFYLATMLAVRESLEENCLSAWPRCSTWWEDVKRLL